MYATCSSTLRQLLNTCIMNIRIILLSAAIIGLFGTTSCNSGSDDDGSPTPSTYSCPNNKSAYIKIDLSTGASYEVTAADNSSGSVAISREATGDKTIFNISFSNTAGVHGLSIDFGSVITAGTHTVDVAAQKPFITLSNTFYTLKTLTVTFDELTAPTDNPLNPDVDFYAKSSGTFSGSYDDPIDNTTKTFTGSFCSDTVAE